MLELKLYSSKIWISCCFSIIYSHILNKKIQKKYPSKNYVASQVNFWFEDSIQINEQIS